MSAPMGPILQQIATLPARSRQGLSNLRQRLFQQGMSLPPPFLTVYMRLSETQYSSHLL